MTTLQPSQLLEQLNTRYATKAFDPSKKLSAEQVNALKEALRLSASSFGLQPWKFIHVKNPEIRAQLVPHSWGQQQVSDASDLFVLCGINDVNTSHVEKYIANIVSTRGTPAEALKGYKDMMIGALAGKSPEQLAAWTRNQVYIALGTLLTACANLGIDSCPMEGFIPAKYDEILGLQKLGLHSILVCPVGYKSPTDRNATYKKVRFPLNEIFIEK